MRLPNKTDIIKKTAFEKRDYMERVCSADDRIIAALDVDSFEKMESIVEELGELSGRFPYEFVCDISKRVPRVYKKNGQVSEQKDFFDVY